MLLSRSFCARWLVVCLFVFISKHSITFSSTSLRLYLANICIRHDDRDAHSLLFTGPFLVRLSPNPQDVEMTSHAKFHHTEETITLTKNYLTDGHDTKALPSLLRTWTMFNPLTPNDHYSGRTAPLTSKCCIFYIYSTNTGTEYFKHVIYSPFFSV